MWSVGWPFPTPEYGADPWPFPMLAAKPDLDGIRAELAAFDTARVYDEAHLLPSGDDDDAEEVIGLVEEDFPAWIDGARAHGRDLLIVRDGGK